MSIYKVTAVSKAWSVAADSRTLAPYIHISQTTHRCASRPLKQESTYLVRNDKAGLGLASNNQIAEKAIVSLDVALSSGERKTLMAP